ncbi:hypothetical protein DXC43_07185 [Subdoligranulum sp. TF05-17AC]|nr:hypothetical protein DXC43_07185 [Subdoligranulum sp. TF05-17AC]
MLKNAAGAPTHRDSAAAAGAARFPLLKKRGRRADAQRFSRGSWRSALPVVKKTRPMRRRTEIQPRQLAQRASCC